MKQKCSLFFFCFGFFFGCFYSLNPKHQLLPDTAVSWMCSQNPAQPFMPRVTVCSPNPAAAWDASLSSLGNGGSSVSQGLVVPGCSAGLRICSAHCFGPGKASEMDLPLVCDSHHELQAVLSAFSVHAVSHIECLGC